MLLRFLLVHSLIFLRDWGSPSISRPFLFHKKKRTGHFGASLHSAVSTVWVEMFDSNWHKKSSEKGWNRAVFGEKMCCLRAPKLFDFRVSVGSSPRNEKYIYIYVYIYYPSRIRLCESSFLVARTATFNPESFPSNLCLWINSRVATPNHLRKCHPKNRLPSSLWNYSEMLQ